MWPKIVLAISMLALGASAIWAEAPGETAPAVVKPRVFETADGTKMVYDVRGEGQTALVFVHCWGCDREYWREQVGVFEGDYRVVTMDLPGHGASGTGRETWSIAGLGADVAALVDKLGLERVVLVGHSMGGPVSLAAAAAIPDQLLGIVCVDTLHDAEFEPPEGMLEGLAGRFEQDFEATMTEMVGAMFPPGADRGTVDWVTAKATATNREAALALFRNFAELELDEMFRAVKAPVRCINAAPRPQGGMPTKIEVNRKYADYDAVLMDDVGHFLQLERPGDFNRHLRKIVAELTAASSGD